MTNADLWKQYQEFTKDVSDNGRKLALSAAAICWIFKTPNVNSFPQYVNGALLAVVLFFAADMLQPLLSAVLIRVWTRSEEKKLYAKTGKIEGDYSKPAWLDAPAYVLWWFKILALATSFALIACHLAFP